MFDMTLFLSPVLLLNGSKSFNIRFDLDEKAVIMKGTRYGKSFESSQTFAEIEQSINDTPGSQETEQGSTIHQGGDRPS